MHQRARRLKCQSWGTFEKKKRKIKLLASSYQSEFPENFQWGHNLNARMQHHQEIFESGLKLTWKGDDNSGKVRLENLQVKGKISESYAQKYIIPFSWQILQKWLEYSDFNFIVAKRIKSSKVYGEQQNDDLNLDQNANPLANMQCCAYFLGREEHYFICEQSE